MARLSGSKRHTAEERRELVMQAAREEFARFGLFGATGEAIAYRAGISHPYLLRLFGSKRELFLAVVERSFDELLGALEQTAAENDGGASLSALEVALREAMGDDGLVAQLHFYAACGDEEVLLVVRRRFADLYRALERRSGADAEELRGVIAGLLFDGAASALRLPDLAGREAWARSLLGPRS